MEIWIQFFALIGTIFAAAYIVRQDTEKKIEKMDDKHREDMKEVREYNRSMDDKWEKRFSEINEKWERLFERMDSKLEIMDAKWERLLLRDQK